MGRINKGIDVSGEVSGRFVSILVSFGVSDQDRKFYLVEVCFGPRQGFWFMGAVQSIMHKPFLPIRSGPGLEVLLFPRVYFGPCQRFWFILANSL